MGAINVIIIIIVVLVALTVFYFLGLAHLFYVRPNIYYKFPVKLRDFVINRKYIEKCENTRAAALEKAAKIIEEQKAKQAQQQGADIKKNHIMGNGFFSDFVEFDHSKQYPPQYNYQIQQPRRSYGGEDEKEELKARVEQLQKAYHDLLEQLEREKQKNAILSDEAGSVIKLQDYEQRNGIYDNEPRRVRPPHTTAETVRDKLESASEKIADKVTDAVDVIGEKLEKIPFHKIANTASSLGEVVNDAFEIVDDIKDKTADKLNIDLERTGNGEMDMTRAFG